MKEPRKRQMETSESSEIKDSETEDEEKPRTRVRKPLSERNREKAKKAEYSTDDSDAEMRAVYQYMYGSSDDEPDVGEPAGEVSKCTEAQRDPRSPVLEAEENIDGQSYQATIWISNGILLILC